MTAAAYCPMTRPQAPMSLAVAITAATPKAITLAGSMTIRRRNENRRWRTASGIVLRRAEQDDPRHRSGDRADLRAAEEEADQRRQRERHEAEAEAAGHGREHGRAGGLLARSRRWTTAAIIPDSEISSPMPTMTEPAASCPNSDGVARRASAR